VFVHSHDLHGRVASAAFVVTEIALRGDSSSVSDWDCHWWSQQPSRERLCINIFTVIRRNKGLIALSPECITRLNDVLVRILAGLPLIQSQSLNGVLCKQSWMPLMAACSRA
jgi:hypothetical protein